MEIKLASGTAKEAAMHKLLDQMKSKPALSISFAERASPAPTPTATPDLVKNSRAFWNLCLCVEEIMSVPLFLPRIEESGPFLSNERTFPHLSLYVRKSL